MLEKMEKLFKTNNKKTNKQNGTINNTAANHPNDAQRTGKRPHDTPGKLSENQSLLYKSVASRTKKSQLGIDLNLFEAMETMATAKMILSRLDSWLNWKTNSSKLWQIRDLDCTFWVAILTRSHQRSIETSQRTI